MRKDPDWYLGSEPFGTTLLVQAIDAFGSELTHWLPVSLREHFEEHYHCLLPPENFDKLQAALSIVTTDLFFKTAYRFNTIAQALFGNGFRPETPEPADVEISCWAVTEGFLLWPPDDDEPEPFSDEVRRYLGARLHEEGFLQPPGILRFALMPKQLARPEDFLRRPQLWNAIQAGQDEKVQAVENEMQARLRLLLEQLEALELSEGDTNGLVQRLRGVAAQAH